jgi:hypothetical protein
MDLHFKLMIIQEKLVVIYNNLINYQKKMDESNETVSINDGLNLSFGRGAKKKRGPKP